MIYLLDTNTVSGVMTGHARVRARLASIVSPNEIHICTIVRGEILYGIQRLPAGKKRSLLETKAMSAFSIFKCDPLPENVGDVYARIKSDAATKGKSISENDLWIGATAISIGAVLVTSDQAFLDIGGLIVEDWR